jgi:uncharacterized damage-inducible protein DinB
MTQREEILASFDSALSHKWESLESALADATQEEASYQHPSYQNEPDELHYPKAGTILWHLVHLAHCYRHYRLRILERPLRPPEPEAPEARTLVEANRNLHEDRNELRIAIASMPEDAFDEQLDNGESVAQFIRNVIRHDSWHAAQIVVMRRLYRYEKQEAQD